MGLTDNTVALFGNQTSNFLAFQTSSSEKMRIDSSGNLLINGTSKFNGYPSGFVTQSIASDSGDLCPILETHLQQVLEIKMQ